jgi:hypothetical protein
MLVSRDTVPSNCGLFARAVSPALARAKVAGTRLCPIAIAPGDTANASPSIFPAPGACTLVCSGRVATDRASSATCVASASSHAVLSSVRTVAGVNTFAAGGSTSIVADTDATTVVNCLTVADTSDVPALAIPF